VLRTDLSFVLVGTLTLLACEARQASAPVVPRDERVVTEVVARVGDRPIGAAEVAARMAAKGLDAEAALERLIDEELLVQEARRRGITEGRDDERALERIMVRAMLHDLEEDLTPDSVPDAEVRADFETQRESLEVPERRKSWHILVKDASDSGWRLAEAIQDEVRAAADPRSVFRRYAEGGEADPPLEVSAEDLPPITRRAGIEQAYKDALFAAESTGPLDTLVETSYGLHVIVLTEILPSEHKTFRDVEGEIRDRLSQKKRFERLAEVVRAGEAAGLVEYDEEGVARLLEMPGLPERVR
jgi:hypothetical protein